jgi:hypothetical protein
VIYNFRIGRWVHFSSKNSSLWRSNRAKSFEQRRERVTSRCTTSALAVVLAARKPRPLRDCRSEASAVSTVRQGGVTRAKPLGRCHAVCPHSPVRARRAATGCSVRRMLPPLAHVVPMPRSTALERKGNTFTTALCPL